MAEDLCRLIGQQITAALDQRMAGGLDSQPTQRRTMADVGDGGMWRTPHGWLAHDVGPAVPPLEKAERLSLIGNISQLGDAGSLLATRIERFQNQADVYSRSEIQLTNAGDRTKGINGAQLDRMSEAEKINFVEVMEGRPNQLDANGFYIYGPGERPVAPMNQRVAYAANLMRTYMRDSDELFIREGVAGYKTFEVPDFYWPIMHATNITRTQEWAQKSLDGLALKIAHQHGRTTATPNDVAAAQTVFDYHVNRQYAKVGANIQRERVWDIGEGRVMDPLRVFELYSQQKWKAVHEKRIFGERDSTNGFPTSVNALHGLLLQNYPGNQRVAHQVDTLIRDTFGIIPSDPTFNSAIVRGLNGLQTLKLSMSVFKNASQTGNTWMATNGKAVLQAIDALARNTDVHYGLSARDFRGMMASVVDNAMYEATLWQGGEGVIGRAGSAVLNYTGFTKMEQFNRSFAGLAGAFYAEQQAKLLAQTGKARYRQQLTELGINVERALEDIKNTGTLALEEKLLAGQKIINATQFRARQSDLPFFATNNPAMWRALLTFRTFSLNQVRLMWDMAAKRPARAALFGLSVMPSIGMGVNFVSDSLKSQVSGQPMIDHQDGMRSYLQAATSAGSFGFISDALYTAYMAGESQSYKDFLLPAMLSSADDYLMAAGQLARGRYPQFARTVGRQFGGLGAAFTKNLFPSENEQ